MTPPGRLPDCMEDMLSDAMVTIALVVIALLVLVA